MKPIVIGLLGVGLVACSGDRSDLESFVTTTKAQHVAHIPPLKEPPIFEHFDYQAELMRSPFVPPSRELTEEVIDVSKDCLQPDLKRRKGRLETYALDNLKMRGSLKDNDTVWALIQTNDNNVYRMGVGEYLGLFHGKIASITPLNVEILELIPDGAGCWTVRTSNMELTGE
ncbi:pilus assembly protein PilP [Shewanella sp. NIFS-20-20]|uniref:pilus assembly protein PilP n=1 Tax=Shewanella sp. NIFS-20-20 TaxID=2853806 RepID=UPI001C4768F1|nr:pilus assembly protein PilP [Shewanella sp. NIFS-20-20]MBV7315628.1 pilus assembly protein PilP [Shewanella sp. NIFS-20-20]